MKRGTIFLFFTFLLPLGFIGFAQKSILLYKPTVHIGNGDIINQGLVGIKGEKIVLVENALTYPLEKSKWDTIIHLKGQELYPGFFGRIILPFPDSSAKTFSTTFYPSRGTWGSAETFHLKKEEGVFYHHIVPKGGRISGSSSILEEKGKLIKAKDGIHLWWPLLTDHKNGKINIHKGYSKKVHEIYTYFTKARKYALSGSHSQKKLEEMRAVFRGEKRLYIHANQLRALVDIIDFKRKLKIKYPVIVGGYNSYKIGDRLKDAEIPIVLTGIHQLPLKEDDPVGSPFRLPYLLQEAGVLFCIQNKETPISLLAIGKSVIANGLKEEDVISAFSLKAAKIYGVAQKIGSIKVGKNASLFVCKNTVFDTRNRQITLTMVEGKISQKK